MENDEIRRTVREGYAKLARESRGCRPKTESCCGEGSSAGQFFSEAGYTAEEIAAVPEGAVKGLACGHPLSFGRPVAGETVLDLGSGPGLDCFLASRVVGRKGRVIGVDMTPEMIDKARRNASKGDYANVEFRLGGIENLPAADGSVDIVISNCVINLSPDKGRVFAEALRVLRPGGRLVVSDLVHLVPVPEGVRESDDLLVGCVANAEMKERYIQMIRDAGFEDVTVVQEKPHMIERLEGAVSAASIVVRSFKPRS
jgi:arsenite methyltransferase